MRSIANMSLTWALVEVPVKVIASTESHSVDLHQVHKKDAGRVRYAKKCEECGENLHTSDIGQGALDADGRMVVLADDDLPDVSRDIAVLDFVPANSVDPLQVEKTYYLQPGGGANRVPRAYRLLVAAMLATKREAVVRFALRSTERVGVLRVRKTSGTDVLCLLMLYWADEIRQPHFVELDGAAPFKPEELAAAKDLIGSLATDWEPQRYIDTRRDVVVGKIAAASKPKRGRRRKTDPEPVVEDLLAKLEQSSKKRRVA